MVMIYEVSDNRPKETQDAVDFLRSIGWTCIPPADLNTPIPQPAKGQVWTTRVPYIEPRTIISVHPSHGAFRDPFVVEFSTPKRGATCMGLESFKAWAKKWKVRPV